MVGISVLITCCGMPFVESKCNCTKKISEGCCVLNNNEVCCEHTNTTIISNLHAGTRMSADNCPSIHHPSPGIKYTL